MNVLHEARKRIHERRYYGRNESEEHIADQLNRWNAQPPTRMRYCKDCGGEVRWMRETPGFSVATGRSGHSYHLTCVEFGRSHWHDERTGEKWYTHEPPFRSSKVIEGPRLAVPVDDERVEHLRFHTGFGSGDCHHYDSHEYRFREGDQESFDQEDLW